jgi:hypothetical protein
VLRGRRARHARLHKARRPPAPPHACRPRHRTKTRRARGGRCWRRVYAAQPTLAVPAHVLVSLVLYKVVDDKNAQEVREDARSSCWACWARACGWARPLPRRAMAPPAAAAPAEAKTVAPALVVGGIQDTYCQLQLQLSDRLARRGGGPPFDLAILTAAAPRGLMRGRPRQGAPGLERGAVRGGDAAPAGQRQRPGTAAPGPHLPGALDAQPYLRAALGGCAPSKAAQRRRAPRRRCKQCARAGSWSEQLLRYLWYVTWQHGEALPAEVEALRTTAAANTRNIVPVLDYLITKCTQGEEAGSEARVRPRPAAPHPPRVAWRQTNEGR